MRRMKHDKLKVTRLSLLAVFALLLIIHSPFIVPASAAESSSSTALQQKVEQIKREIASKAAQMKQEVSSQIQNRAFVGQIQSIQGKTVTVLTARGLRTVKTDEYTLFQQGAKKNLTLKDIARNDYIAALGEVDETDVMTAKRIVEIGKPDIPKLSAFWGQVQSIRGGEITLLRNDNRTIRVATGPETSLRLGSDDASLADVRTGRFLITVGSPLDKDSTNSRFIYLLNPNGQFKIERPATSSATPSAAPKK